MGFSPIFNFYYPDDDTPNDLRVFFLKLAYGVDAEISRQGPLENRPPAGTQGRMYLATTWKDPYDGNTVKPWNVAYRDNGSSWVQLNDSAVQIYYPVWTLEAGSSMNIGLYGGSPGPCEYQVKAGSLVWVNVNQLLTLTGTAGTHGVRAGLPINALSFAGVAGSAQNRPAEVEVNADIDNIEWHSGNYANGQLWDVNTSQPMWFRATATYRAG